MFKVHQCLKFQPKRMLKCPAMMAEGNLQEQSCPIFLRSSLLADKLIARWLWTFYTRHYKALKLVHWKVDGRGSHEVHVNVTCARNMNLHRLTMLHNMCSETNARHLQVWTKFRLRVQVMLRNSASIAESQQLKLKHFECCKQSHGGSIQQHFGTTGYCI